MLLYAQKPPGEGESVGRPRTGQMPLQHFRASREDWSDLHAVAGRRAHAILRDFIRWYLRRPGAKLPDRPSREEIQALTSNSDLKESSKERVDD